MASPFRTNRRIPSHRPQRAESAAVMTASGAARRADRAADARQDGPQPDRPAERLRRLGICVPAALVDRAAAIATTQQTTRNAVLKLALECGIGALDSPEPKPTDDARVAARKRAPEALEQLRFRIG